MGGGGWVRVSVVSTVPPAGLQLHYSVSMINQQVMGSRNFFSIPKIVPFQALHVLDHDIIQRLRLLWPQLTLHYLRLSLLIEFRAAVASLKALTSTIPFAP